MQHCAAVVWHAAITATANPFMRTCLHVLVCLAAMVAWMHACMHALTVFMANRTSGSMPKPPPV